MKRLLALLLIPACTGGERANTGMCPSGEVCSPDTPKGLQFIGKDLVDSWNLSGPSATAIGGTQAIALQYDRGDGVLIALDLPYVAKVSGGYGVSVSATSGSVVTVAGMTSGASYLRVTDPDGMLYDRKLVGAGSLQKIDLVPATGEAVDVDAEIAYAPGTIDIGVALYGTVGTMTDQRLVDDSMTLDVAGGHQTHWDTVRIDNAQPGTSTLMVTAGDKPAAPFDLVVAASADSIVAGANNVSSLATNQPVMLCFNATTGPRVLVGLPWTFTVDGAPGDVSIFAPNCVDVKTTKTTGQVAVTAAAGGKTITAMLNVTAMARTAPARKTRELPTTAGERAAM